jgi:hypothetical protein
LGRSLRHMNEVVPTLAQCGVDFKSWHAPLEITMRSGTRLCHLFGALAALERDLIRECIEAGRTGVRQWGRGGGHPPGRSSQAAATALAVEPWYREGQVRVRQLADKLYITKSAFNGARAAGHAPKSWPHPVCTSLRLWPGCGRLVSAVVARLVHAWPLPQRGPGLRQRHAGAGGECCLSPGCSIARKV